MRRPAETPEATARRRLSALAAERPELAGLARLRLALLDLLPEREGLLVALDVTPDSARAHLAAGEPWLHGATLTVDAARAAAILRRLAETAAEAGAPGSPALLEATRRRRFEATELLAAALGDPSGGASGVARALDLPETLLATLAGLALEPLLLAARERVMGPAGYGFLGARGEGKAPGAVPASPALPLQFEPRRPAAGGTPRRPGDGPPASPAAQPLAPEPGSEGWSAGYCPCCGAWPTLAVLEGLERSRWLTCGRCGTSWRRPWLWCPYCDNADHRTLGSLQVEGDERRGVGTCEVCRGYLKTVTALALPPLPLIGVEDAATVDLDLVALDAGWARPDPPGFAVEVTLRPSEPRRHGWLGDLGTRLRGGP